MPSFILRIVLFASLLLLSMPAEASMCASFVGASGRVSSRESDGHTYSYGYTLEGFLSEAVSSVQQPTRPVNRGQQTQDFSACYEYDSRGNMLSLTRRGVVDVTPSGVPCYGESDRILAEYEGNRLTMLHMSSESSPFSSRTGLGQNGRASLEYDDSGRLIADDSRGIVLIEYDNDDRPVRTVFASGREQHDSWDGLGNHLCTWYCRKVGRHTVTKGLRRYTGDGHVLRCGAGDTLEMARFPGGFMDALGRPHYYVPDYRGSVKAVLGPTGSVEQRVDYYPYGEPWVEPYGVSRNRFLYGGKERLTTDGLNEYDQTARRYVASFPRFTTPDAMAGNSPYISPYAYCSGDPINKIDPSGNTDFYTNSYYHYWHDDGLNQSVEISDEEFEEITANDFDFMGERYNRILENAIPRDDLFFTISDVLSSREFIGWGWHGIKNCFELAKRQSNSQLSGKKSDLSFSSNDEVIIKYIIEQLTQGKSVIAGVKYSPIIKSNNRNPYTNHFVTIVGMGYDCSNYFEYYDNATSNPILGRDVKGNRLYYDIDNNAFMDYSNIRVVNIQSYMLNEIRINR